MFAALATAALALAGGYDYRLSCEVLQGDPLGSRWDGSIVRLWRPPLGAAPGRLAQLRLTDGPDGFQVAAVVRPRHVGSVDLWVAASVWWHDPAAGRRELSAVGIREAELGRPVRLRLGADAAERQTWLAVTVDRGPVPDFYFARDPVIFPPAPGER